VPRRHRTDITFASASVNAGERRRGIVPSLQFLNI
jgi:hypothetical protein